MWHNMKRRCLDGGSYQSRYPTYRGCTLHQDFSKFENFMLWAVEQVGFGCDGYQLDKDILIPGNKVYGPNTCVFVPRSINSMLTHNKTNSNGLPTGVLRIRSKFRAQIKADGVVKTIGYFDDIESASCAYKKAKKAEITRQAHLYRDKIDPRVFVALIEYEV